MTTTMPVKSIDERLAEALAMRSQLEAIGAFMHPCNRDAFKTASNQWITDGVPSTLTLRIDETRQTKVCVQFSLTRKSGITLSRS